MTKEFYKPVVARIGNAQEIPVIVYPCIGVEKMLDRKKHNAIEEHVMNVYNANKNKLKSWGYCNIDILWSDEQDVMSDVWIYDKNWDSGDLVDEKTFKGLELETYKGVSADFGLILLGRESELKLKIKKEIRETGDALAAYIDGQRPELPHDLTPVENFYLAD